MRYALFIAIGLVIIIAAVFASVRNEGPHSFSEAECKDCHIDPEGNPAALKAPMTMLCAGCHKRTMRASSHPVDVAPQLARVPGDLPLRDGRITCGTCHNVHGDPSLVFGMRSYFLRRPTTDMKFFCLACHEENRAKPGHKELVTVAHMGGQFVVTDPSEPIDPLSIECIGCHDGSTGTSVEYTIGDGVWRHQSGTPHPIGVHYNRARMRNGSLAPISALNRKLRFFAGRIGCGTCHDMYSRLPSRLVMADSDGALCTSCHLGK